MKWIVITYKRSAGQLAARSNFHSTVIGKFPLISQFDLNSCSWNPIEFLGAITLNSAANIPILSSRGLQLPFRKKNHLLHANFWNTPDTLPEIANFRHTLKNFTLHSAKEDSHMMPTTSSITITFANHWAVRWGWVHRSRKEGSLADAIAKTENSYAQPTFQSSDTLPDFRRISHEDFWWVHITQSTRLQRYPKITPLIRRIKERKTGPFNGAILCHYGDNFRGETSNMNLKLKKYWKNWMLQNFVLITTANLVEYR